VRKTLVSIILGCALLASSGAALADSVRKAEPRWGIRPERTAPSPALDFARWMARRLIEAVGVTQPEPPSPVSAPAITPDSDEGDAVCPPERVHCPVG
jgi:hypothetical protein